ncbi:hypothetical protein PR048_019371 [Dryococelus australis]|uniref:Retrovirus-related Pol polyprotein from transposon TNT 1-94-like beta-barrel domain-containing protein n=1 Tax=Dryococelus australis TaxID=614101 RepID=A0ABQ9H3D2_9NEOP|nr:hypothetical protein PR048_019371 [Dryococelus australis]
MTLHTTTTILDAGNLDLENKNEKKIHKSQPVYDITDYYHHIRCRLPWPRPHDLESKNSRKNLCKEALASRDNPPFTSVAVKLNLSAIWHIDCEPIQPDRPPPCFPIGGRRVKRTLHSTTLSCRHAFLFNIGENSIQNRHWRHPVSDDAGHGSMIVEVKRQPFIFATHLRGMKNILIGSRLAIADWMRSVVSRQPIRMQIPNRSLEGQSNWRTWTYKASARLCGVSGCMDILEGTLQDPEALKIDATPAEVTLYNSYVESFVKADSNALRFLTTNMTENTLEKVMRFSTACEAWMELHRLFDMGSTLPEAYFKFRYSWLLMNKSERAIENLTNQHCAFEKALKSRTADLGKEALTTTSKKASTKVIGKEAKHVTAVEGLMFATASLASDDGDQGWYLDNGATNHVTYQRDVFNTRENFSVNISVKTANDEAIQAAEFCGQDNPVIRSRVVTFNEEPILNFHIVKHNLNQKVEDLSSKENAEELEWKINFQDKTNEKEKNNEDHDSVNMRGEEMRKRSSLKNKIQNGESHTVDLGTKESTLSNRRRIASTNTDQIPSTSDVSHDVVFYFSDLSENISPRVTEVSRSAGEIILEAEVRACESSKDCEEESSCPNGS